APTDNGQRRRPGPWGSSPGPGRRPASLPSEVLDLQVAELDPPFPALQADVAAGLQEVPVLAVLDPVLVLLQVHVLHVLADEGHRDPRPLGDDPEVIPLAERFVDPPLQGRAMPQMAPVQVSASLPSGWFSSSTS